MSAMDRRLITHANWLLVFCTALLFGFGMVNLYSASAVRLEDGLRFMPYFDRQLLWGALGLGAMVLTTAIDYRTLRVLAPPIFLVSVILLVLVPLIGETKNGATRWINLGFTEFQPSELAKIAVLLLGSTLLSRRKSSLGWIDLFQVFGVCLIPCVLIFIQPDLGTALNLLLLLGGLALYQGIRLRVFKVLCVVLPLSLPLAWLGILADYHKQRILTFLDPLQDIKGAGYQIYHSQIAIGSGQMWGKGFQGGTHHLSRFLPEKHTDFAVAVFSEEWGFVGCVVLMTVFCIFLLSIITTARDAKDRFGSLLCAGVFFYFFWQILINIGMVVGLMPVVGIPLPFISYGGTAALVNFILLGLVLNVSMRRYMFKTN